MGSELEQLQEKHRRLRVVAQALIDSATAVGNVEEPMAAVPPHRLRALRRELQHVPQPTALATMGS